MSNIRLRRVRIGRRLMLQKRMTRRRRSVVALTSLCLVTLGTETGAVELEVTDNVVSPWVAEMLCYFQADTESTHDHVLYCRGNWTEWRRSGSPDSPDFPDVRFHWLDLRVLSHSTALYNAGLSTTVKVQ